jgi:propanediol dehydratase small subunit
MVITGYKVDPTTQELTSVEINGETVETGGSANLVDFEETWKVNDYGAEIKVTNEELKKHGFDGMSSVDITLTDFLPESVTIDDLTVTVGTLPQTVTKTATIRDLDGNVLYEASLKITLQSQAG